MIPTRVFRISAAVLVLAGGAVALAGPAAANPGLVFPDPTAGCGFTAAPRTNAVLGLVTIADRDVTATTTSNLSYSWVSIAAPFVGASPFEVVPGAGIQTPSANHAPNAPGIGLLTGSYTTPGVGTCSLTPAVVLQP